MVTVGTGLQEQHRLRLADDVAASDDHRMRAGQRHTGVFEQLHHAIGGARHEARLAGHQRTDVADMKAVDILQRRNGLDHPLRVQVGRQRHLDQDAVHRRVVVQVVDASQQHRFGGVGGQVVQDRADPRLVAVGDLVLHVDAGGRVVAHQDHSQPGLMAARRQDTGALAHLGADLAREGGAIEDSCSHVVVPGEDKDEGNFTPSKNLSII
jgi:hypothetical protein